MIMPEPNDNPNRPAPGRGPGEAPEQARVQPDSVLWSAEAVSHEADRQQQAFRERESEKKKKEKGA